MEGHQETGTTAGESSVGRPRWRRAMVTMSLLLGGLLTVAAVAPGILIRTSLRNDLLNEAVAAYGLKADAATAGGGWLAPVVFRNLKIADAEGRIHVTVKELRTSQTFVDVIAGGNELGEITLIEPDVQILTDDDGNLPLPDVGQAKLQPVKVRVEGGRLELSVPWREESLVSLDELDFEGELREVAGGFEVETSSVVLMDRKRLTDADVSRSVTLVAPILAQSTIVEGEVSAVLQPIRGKISQDGRLDASWLPLRGSLVLHRVDARLRQAWVRVVAQHVGRRLGSRLPDALQVAEDSRYTFSVGEDGIRHTGMSFLLPQLLPGAHLDSSGVLGLDETLDLTFQVRLPVFGGGDQARGFLGMLQNAARLPIPIRVLGTVDDPVLVLPEGMDVLSDLSQRVDPARHTAEPPEVSHAVYELIRDVSNEDQEANREALPGSILRLIRAIDDNARRSESRSGGKE